MNLQENTKPLFFVMLRDSFEEKYRESLKDCLFPSLENPYKSALKHLTRGKRYPVIEIVDDNRLTILDDSESCYTVNNHLFKYAGD